MTTISYRDWIADRIADSISSITYRGEHYQFAVSDYAINYRDGLFLVTPRDRTPLVAAVQYEIGHESKDQFGYPMKLVVQNGSGAQFGVTYEFLPYEHHRFAAALDELKGVVQRWCVREFNITYDIEVDE